METTVWILAGLYLASLGAIWFFRTWFTAEIERRVQHAFDEKLERIRSELRVSEGEIAILRDRLLGARANRQVLLDKRRLEAIEGLWAAIGALTPFNNAMQMIAPLDLEKLEAAAAKDARYKTVIEMTTQNLPDAAKYDRSAARKERPFVSPLAWAYFAAYESIVLATVARAMMLRMGVEDGNELINMAGIRETVKVALPDHAAGVDEIQAVERLAPLVEILEKRLLAELNKTLQGEEQDRADAEKAAAILGRVDDMVKRAQ